VPPLVVLLESMQLIYLSYFTSHWVLFIIVVLLVIALLAATWFLKNWKYAAAAILLTVFALAYQSANMDGYKRKVAEDAQAQVVVLQKRLLTLNIVAQADAARQKVDREYMDQLEAKVSETPHNDSPCLDLDAARRVRGIRSGIGHKPTTHTARRPSVVLQKRSAAP
jgi:signal transduction histidine kinase